MGGAGRQPPNAEAVCPQVCRKDLDEGATNARKGLGAVMRHRRGIAGQGSLLMSAFPAGVHLPCMRGE